MLLFTQETNTWERLSTKSPENADAQIYISRDQCPKFSREIQLTKRLLRSFKAVQPDINFHYSPHRRAVCVDKKLLAKVEAKSFTDFVATWVHDHIDFFKVDKAKIKEQFDANAGLSPNYAYSV